MRLVDSIPSRCNFQIQSTDYYYDSGMFSFTHLPLVKCKRFEKGHICALIHICFFITLNLYTVWNGNAWKFTKCMHGMEKFVAFS